MTTTIITVLVEGSVCHAAGRQYLARSVNAAVGGARAGTRNYPHSAQFLTPWEWDLVWEKLPEGNKTPTKVIEAWRKPLGDWVTERLNSAKAANKAELHSLWATDIGHIPDETEEPNDDDPAWEDAQSWVMLQMQLARMDGRISHGLKLCYVAEYDDPASPIDPGVLHIESITVGGRVFKKRVLPESFQPKINGSDTQGYFLADDAHDLVFNIIPDTEVEELTKSTMESPVDWVTRRVDFQKGKTDTSDGDWLADAEAKIEALCDPVLALLKLGADAEEAGESLTINADALTGKPQMNDGLREMLLATPDVLLLPLLAADDKDDYKQVADWAKATAWRDQLRASDALEHAFAKLKDHLYDEKREPLDLAESENREKLRAFWMPSLVEGREDFAGYLLDAIIGAGKAMGISDSVLRWLGREEASEVLMGRLLPAAVGLAVMRKMAAAAVGQTKDREFFENEFQASYSEVLGNLLRKPDGTSLNPQLNEELLRDLFKRSESAGDFGARDGLTFPVEAIFARPDEFDPHEVLDGYLIAIRQTNNPHSNPGAWQVVTRGTVSCLEVPSGDPLLVPNPPAIEQGAYNEQPDPTIGKQAYQTERRHALISYHGLSLLPDAEKAEEKAILTYGSIHKDNGLPSLVYGGLYEVAVGYQALGGILPDGFCVEDVPLDFNPNKLDPANLASNDPGMEPVRELHFMRTMIPGAPDLRTQKPIDGQEAPPLARLWQAEEDGVRPLWKEVAEVGDSHFEKARKLARTKFLAEADQGAVVSDTFEFFASPPNLPTAPSRDRPGADAVLRYWRRRDEQLWGTPMPDDGKVTRVSDPAVVGSKKDANGKKRESEGGIRIRVYDPAAPSAPVHLEDVKLSKQNFLKFTISPGEFSVNPGEDGIELNCPPGESRVVVLTTLVDEDFLKGGPDQRFADGLLTVRDREGEAGSIAFAVEVLPARAHLPHEKQLWSAIAATRGSDNGLVLALDVKYANPDSKAPLLEAPFKYVGEIACEWQEWRWDGGPVRTDEVPSDNGDVGLEEYGEETFASFEQLYFNNRGSRGASNRTPFQLRSPPGDKALTLVHRPGRANMGATYYRARLAATSRYDSLMAALPMALEEVLERDWRGIIMASRRIDRLPTPQISGLIPLGGRIRQEADPNMVQAGAFALVLDTPWYDIHSGAGLKARLQCEVIWEEDGDPKYPAAAISEMVNFFGKEADGAHRDHPNPMQPLGFKSERTIEDVGVLGLTRDRGSSVAIYTGSLAFFDSLIDKKPIPADYTARLRCRAVISDKDKDSDPKGQFASDWSQSLLIEFEPTIQSATIAGTYNPASGEITLTAKADGAGTMARWRHMLNDQGSDTRMMRQGLSAMLFRATTNYIGETVLRVVGAGDLERVESESGLKLAVKGEERPTHVRIFETARREATPITGDNGMEQLQNLAMQLLPEGSEQPFEPGQALMRVGPLIELENV